MTCVNKGLFGPLKLASNQAFNTARQYVTIVDLNRPTMHFQIAISRKRKKLPEIRWCQNSCIVEGFHPLFHESDVAPLFHPLSALFLPSFYFDGPVWGRMFV